MKGIRKSFIGGNWKCNNKLSQSIELITNVYNKLQYSPNLTCTKLLLEIIACPIFLHLPQLLPLVKNNILLGAQNCSKYSLGAYTGQINPQQILDIGVKWVILGHSQRRILQGQSNSTVGEKIKNAMKNGLNVIACIGQQLKHRQSNKTFQILQAQLDAIKAEMSLQYWSKIVIAYEPVWAIGTGKVANQSQVKQVHSWIRNYLNTKINPSVSQSTRIIYGGSVNEKNCVSLFGCKDLDGFLVGGASLKPSFNDIVQACTK